MWLPGQKGLKALIYTDFEETFPRENFQQIYVSKSFLCLKNLILN